jgi:hypothetical protein
VIITTLIASMGRRFNSICAQHHKGMLVASWVSMGHS